MACAGQKKAPGTPHYAALAAQGFLLAPLVPLELSPLRGGLLLLLVIGRVVSISERRDWLLLRLRRCRCKLSLGDALGLLVAHSVGFRVSALDVLVGSTQSVSPMLASFTLFQSSSGVSSPAWGDSSHCSPCWLVCQSCQRDASLMCQPNGTHVRGSVGSQPISECGMP